MWAVLSWHKVWTNFLSEPCKFEQNMSLLRDDEGEGVGTYIGSDE